MLNNQKSRRICHEVIARMFGLIPGSPETKPFVDALKLDYDDALYKAPEQSIQWIRTGETLRKFIEIPTEDWHFEVLSEFSGRSIEEIKRLVNEVEDETETKE